MHSVRVQGAGCPWVICQLIPSLLCGRGMWPWSHHRVGDKRKTYKGKRESGRNQEESASVS